ncbi:hypothetical protein DM01DRAFT_1334861 [Hesseltinella vesiculosa]|uniref:Uncharacterized protein n=1 Tax=Hesseltinella vesiculosa TaxID=101127 RepID=A0A1X2GKY2_9FUNG|nr:hypothetical protein DM01DRAFT_1334861 [Hesseltinella vesiculosa]
MSRLRDKVAALQHASALEVWTQIQKKEKVGAPRWLDKALRQVERDGLHLGDTIALSGKSGSGKSYLLESMIQQQACLWIQLDRPFQHQYGHVFAPKTRGDLLALEIGLASWFDQHPQTRWVAVDGQPAEEDALTLKGRLMDQLLTLQQHWPFVLVYTTLPTSPRLPFTYRVDCTRQNTAVVVCLVSPSSRATRSSLLAID